MNHKLHIRLDATYDFVRGELDTKVALTLDGVSVDDVLGRYFKPIKMFPEGYRQRLGRSEPKAEPEKAKRRHASPKKKNKAPEAFVPSTLPELPVVAQPKAKRTNGAHAPRTAVEARAVEEAMKEAAPLPPVTDDEEADIEPPSDRLSEADLDELVEALDPSPPERKSAPASGPTLLGPVVPIDPHNRVPCPHCPFRRDSLPGDMNELAASPEDLVEAIALGSPVACPSRTGMQCAGAGIFRENACIEAGGSRVLRLARDKARVFATHLELCEHHDPEGEATGE